MRRQRAEGHAAETGRGNGIGLPVTWPTARAATRSALGVAGALAVSALAACGNPPAPAPPASGTVNVPIQPTITPLQTFEPTVDPSAAGAGGDFDVSDQLTTDSCAQVGGSWSYAGTMANPEAVEHTFTVAIFLVKTSDMSTLETKEVEVRIPAGGKAPVVAKDFFTGASDGVECLTGATVKEQ